MSVIDELLENVKPDQRTALEHIRQLVSFVTPDADEVMTYGMPGFKYKGKYLISFAAFKDHMSIFPGAEPIDVLKDELRAFKTSKGTVQFTLEQPIPDDLLLKIIRLSKDRIVRTTR